MEDVVIRKATINDLEEIIELNKLLFSFEYENFDSTLDTNWPLSEIGKNYFLNTIKNGISFVAVVNKRIVGYLCGSLNTEYSYNKTKQAELDNMCILDKHRKSGIGTKLFEEFKKTCKENNIEEIKVTASYMNKNAIDFYKKNNFIEADITLKQKIK